MTEQLPLAIAAEPAPRVNSTAPPKRRAELQRKAVRLIERLRQGPASSVELVSIAGLRFGARVDEARRFLRRQAGYSEWDTTKAAIRCDRADASNPVYTLEDWA